MLKLYMVRKNKEFIKKLSLANIRRLGYHNEPGIYNFVDSSIGHVIIGDDYVMLKKFEKYLGKYNINVSNGYQGCDVSDSWELEPHMLDGMLDDMEVISFIKECNDDILYELIEIEVYKDE